METDERYCNGSVYHDLRSTPIPLLSSNPDLLITRINLSCGCGRQSMQHWILDLITAFEAFVRSHDIGFCFEPDSPTYAERKYLNLADWKQVANSAFYVTSTVVGDAFMVRFYPSLTCSIGNSVIYQDLSPSYRLGTRQAHRDTPSSSLSGSYR